MMTFPRYGTVKNLPNHQPVWLWLVMIDYGWQFGYASLGYSLWGGTYLDINHDLSIHYWVGHASLRLTNTS